MTVYVIYRVAYGLVSRSAFSRSAANSSAAFFAASRILRTASTDFAIPFFGSGIMVPFYPPLEVC